MAATSGRAGASVIQQLQSAPWQFDFFQVVRLLESHAFEQVERGAGEPRFAVGLDHAPGRECVRFRSLASHQFPPGAISSITLPAGGDPRSECPPEIVVTFLGMIGPQGVLPQHYTGLVIQRTRAKDTSLRDFLDVFQHRILSLFYRAWEKYRFPLAYERSQRCHEEDLFTRCAFCLLGLGTGRMRGRQDFDDNFLLYHAGSFAHYPRSAGMLENVINDFLQMPAEVKQFHGQWLYLREEDQSSMPCDRWPEGRNCEMRGGVVLGERVWDIACKFRICLGPLDYSAFRRLFPGGSLLRPLCQLVRTYAGLQFDFDVQPVLRAEDVPWCRLGGDGSDPSRLAWNTWLRSRALDHDVSDAVFSMES
jgi:type VI secretion system protein ImpH